MNHKNPHVGIIGASGWLGQSLIPQLLSRHYQVTGFSRSPKNSPEISWRTWDGQSPIDLTGLDAVINLAGESIDQRWNDSVRQKLRDSRVNLTAKLCHALPGSSVKTLLNASGIGYYGHRSDQILTETDAPGDGFLAQLCEDWEAAATAPPTTRVALLRTGIVLGPDGGAWNRMRTIFQLGIGGKLGNGKQWMPWIHLHDEIAAIIFCLENPISGPVNLVSPNPVTNTDFTRTVGQVLRRPTLFAAPAFALKLALGDFAQEGLLASTRALPEKLTSHHFTFKFPTIADALTQIANPN